MRNTIFNAWLTSSFGRSRVILVSMVVLGAVLWSGCRTTKSRDELSALGKLYQNMTAHYNGYFNATEIMKASIVSLEEGYQDNYHALLPVFEHNAVFDAGTVAGELDRAIQKSSVVISLHRPSKWTDDCYLLIGQAQYLKQDYESAQKTLEYATRNFDEQGRSKEKVKKKQQLTKRERQAKRLAAMKEKRKEIEKKRKKMAKDRKERNKEIEDLRKARTKERKEAKKERDDQMKDRKKTREQDAKDRAKARKIDQKEREKARKEAIKDKRDNKPMTVREQRELEERKAKEEAERKAKEKEREAREVAREADRKRKAEQEQKEREARKKKEEEKKTQEEDIVQKDEAQTDGEDEEEELSKKEKKKKKKEEEIKDGFLAHVPSHNMAQVWLARTYVERDFTSKAEQVFSKIKRQESVDETVWRIYYPSLADYYIKSEQYDLAIPALESAIDYANQRKYKARYAYILGQIHTMQNQHMVAADYFKQAGKWSNQFDMEFSAALNERIAKFRSDNTSIDKIDRALNRMAKEDKYLNYRDQIFFKLAMLQLEQGDKDQGITYLDQALEYASANPKMKTEIHFTLAELYYDKDEFPIAYDHYRTALSGMNKEEPRNAPATKKADNIQKIARLEKEVELQDSLFMLASLDDSELRKRAAEIISARNTKVKEATQQANRQTKQIGDFGFGNTIAPTASTSTIQSNFFAYDEKARRKGEREFNRVWGNRLLVDDWRRQSEIDNRDAQREAEAAIASSKEATEQEVDQVFSNLPRTPEQIAEGKKDLADATFDLGMEYRNKINRLDLSSSAFTRFIEEATADDERRPQAYYFLYLNARDQGDLTTAKRYVDLLQSEHPDTKYAILAKDPSYMKAILAKEGSPEAHYQRTYEAFEAGDYKTVHSAMDEAQAQFGTDHPHLAKYALLKAMTVGNMEGKPPYIEALRQVVAQYPNTPEQIKAREIIRFLNGDEDALAGSGNARPKNRGGDPSVFKKTPNKLHYIIVVVHNDDVNSIQDVKISISNYNKVFHSLERLTMRDYMIDQEKEISSIMIRKFENKKEAMSYYEEVEKRKGEFLPEGTDADIYAVSQSNYREIIKARTIDGYIPFFQENYLNE